MSRKSFPTPQGVPLDDLVVGRRYLFVTHVKPSLAGTFERILPVKGGCAQIVITMSGEKTRYIRLDEIREIAAVGTPARKSEED